MSRDTIVIFVSRAAYDIAVAEVKLFAAEVAPRAAEKNITGVLIMAGNYFLQVLEGPEDHIQEALEKRVLADPRQREVRILYKEPIETRMFAQWSASCVNVDEQYDVKLKDYRQLRELVRAVMAQESLRKDAMALLIKGFSVLLQKHKVAA